jgi:ATP-dependent helicase HrpB
LPDAPLPVLEVLPALRAALRQEGRAVLQAPPGTGKTTAIPPALLDEPWLAGRRIILLEPRRLAARAAARRMASLAGEPVGATIGYRVRFDTRVSEITRIEVVTEGVLTRLRQSDPGLETAGIIIFDEFHERSIHADLGLALVLETRAILRPDLRILVMSATLDGARVADLLGGAPVLTGSGRLHPIDTWYRPRRPGARLDQAVASVIGEALDREPGDVLGFLPGAGEIHRTAERLEAVPRPGVRVFRLHGMLPAAEQDAAIAPAPAGTRKVVLATSIAETSLTIEGVRVVVDGGLMRVPRFSARTGMTRLETIRVSRASADQRRGRAGRTGPGVCYRLWASEEDAGLVPQTLPEILAADLASLALDLAAAGVRRPDDLPWLDPPPDPAWRQATELLRLLGALDRQGAVSPHGRRMAALPLHPRLAHLLLEAGRLGLAGTAADLAALLSDRDIARRTLGKPVDADIRLRIDAMRRNRSVAGLEVDRPALQRARAEAAEWRRRIRARSGGTEDDAGRLLALAYPDRVGRLRGPAGRFLLRSGRGATLPGDNPLAVSEWIVVAELDDEGAEGTIRLAAPLDPEDVRELIEREGERQDRIEWDDSTRSVTASRVTRLGAIVVEEGRLPDPDPDQVQRVLLAAIRKEGLSLLSWGDEGQRLRARLAFLHQLDATWPDVSDTALIADLEQWLGPDLRGVRRTADVSGGKLAAALLRQVPFQLRDRLDRLAPERIEVPSGSRIAVDYQNPAAPVLAVRLQEIFGWRETPRVAGGRVPLTLHLLSPARRPVQVTRDLASFWKTGYFDVRRDLRGRYPKHAWPDDPLTAPATRKTRRRS